MIYRLGNCTVEDPLVSFNSEHRFIIHTGQNYIYYFIYAKFVSKQRKKGDLFSRADVHSEVYFSNQFTRPVYCRGKKK